MGDVEVTPGRDIDLGGLIRIMARKGCVLVDPVRSQRITGLVARFAAELDMMITDIGRAVTVCFMHDIGRVGVADFVLNKRTHLTQSERIEIERHVLIGYEMARMLPGLFPVAELILHHHERWDGSGYPSRLRGDSIPLICRMVAIVDSFTAMTEDRPHRPRMSREAALSQISLGAGTQFDPMLVPAFIDLLTREGRLRPHWEHPAEIIETPKPPQQVPDPNGSVVSCNNCVAGGYCHASGFPDAGQGRLLCSICTKLYKGRTTELITVIGAQRHLSRKKAFMMFQAGLLKWVDSSTVEMVGNPD
jgi:hypothetical protein